MTGKYDVRGKYRRKEEHTADEETEITVDLPACVSEILSPSSSSAFETWKPRSANDITVDDPVLRRRRTLFGNSYVDHAAFNADVRAAEEENKAVTGLYKAKTDKELALQAYERVLAGRASTPLLIEHDKAVVGGQVALARSALQRTCAQIKQQELKLAQELTDDARRAELSTLEFETDRARMRKDLAEANAMAAHADELAALKVKTEKVKAEAEITKAEWENGVPSGDEGEAEPAAFTAAMARQRKRADIARAAGKREAAILAKVGGDESLLDDEELDELEEIRQAKAQAQQSVDKDSALGAIFPDADGEEKRS